MEFLFLTLLTALFCISYFVFYLTFPIFFGQSRPEIGRRCLLSLALIIALSVAAYFISISIPDEQIGNRFLHAFGGGFLAFLMCWLVARDTNLRVSKFQFFVFSFLIATALGVGNELLEFALEITTGLIFAPTIADTWL